MKRLETVTGYFFSSLAFVLAGISILVVPADAFADYSGECSLCYPDSDPYSCTINCCLDFCTEEGCGSKCCTDGCGSDQTCIDACLAAQAKACYRGNKYCEAYGVNDCETDPRDCYYKVTDCRCTWFGTVTGCKCQEP
jgi:hypothetical protein